MQSRLGMMRLNLAISAALLLLLSACTMAVPFDVSSGVALQHATGAYTVSERFDLSTAGDLWSQRHQVDSVSVEEVLVTVLSLGPEQRASVSTITLSLRAEDGPADGSQDLVLPPFELTFVPGHTSRIPGSPQLDGFMLAVLRGEGRFTLLASGTLGDAADAVLHVAISGRASYTAGG
jgi:hypothetical protein